MTNQLLTAYKHFADDYFIAFVEGQREYCHVTTIRYIIKVHSGTLKATVVPLGIRLHGLYLSGAQG